MCLVEEIVFTQGQPRDRDNRDNVVSSRISYFAMLWSVNMSNERAVRDD